MLPKEEEEERLMRSQFLLPEHATAANVPETTSSRLRFPAAAGGSILHFDLLNESGCGSAPDCGVKTRGWAEVEPALRNVVIAKCRVRNELMREPLHTGAPAARPADVSNWKYSACNCT